MISSATLLAYALASFVLIVIPGPSVLFVVGRALAHGRRTALATVCGNAAGNYVVAACVALGIGTVVERSGQAFMAVKLVGALYLIWLGIGAIRRRRALAGSLGAPAAPHDGRRTPHDGGHGVHSGQHEGRGDRPVVHSDRRAVREGFVVGVTNPKALILFGAVLPQFVNRPAGHVPVQMLLLGLVSISIGLVSDSAWGVAASAVRTWFARSPRRFEILGGAGGLAMIGVGLTVALTGRRN